MKKQRTVLFIIFSIIFLVVLSLNTGNAADVIINTVVGNHDAGFNGDNILAINASLNNPMGVCLDEFGNIYIADTYNSRIRKVDNLGVIDTVAGNGIFGYNGDEKRGTKCSFAFPMGVHAQTYNKEKKTVNLYIADTRNNRIRMINEYGIMRTVAGSGRFGFSGDHGPAEKADLQWPASVVLDADGNIYIADTFNNRIRVVYMKGAIAGDAQKKIISNPQQGYIYTLAGSGKEGYGGDTEIATKANLFHPWDIFPVGTELYISDQGNHIIRKVASDGTITTIAGEPGVAGYNGDILSATKEKINTPFGIWADMNNLYVCDGKNSRIRKVDPKANAISTFCGIGEFGYTGDGAPAAEAMLSHPIDIFGDGNGSFLMIDIRNQCIRKISGAEAPKKAPAGGQGQ